MIAADRPSPAPVPRRTTPPARRVALAVVSALALASCSSAGSDAAKTTVPTSAAPSNEKVTATTSTTAARRVPTSPEAAAALLEDRPVEVQVPPSYRAGTPAPLLVLLHGFGTDGKVQGAYLGLTPAVVGEAGMLYVQPDGTRNGAGRRFWNATAACCAGPAPVDDSAYLLAVIDHVSSEYAVDPERVFIIGHSNGGFMAYRMACDHADTIAAVISLEGAADIDPSACDPSEPVATLEVHGTADRTIAYDGGRTGFGPYPSAEETVAAWAAHDGCRDEPSTEPSPATRVIVEERPPAQVTSYDEGCDPGGHAELWTQPEGGHIPAWTDDFATQLLDWLLAHPEP